MVNHEMASQPGVWEEGAPEGVGDGGDARLRVPSAQDQQVHQPRALLRRTRHHLHAVERLGSRVVKITNGKPLNAEAVRSYGA